MPRSTSTPAYTLHKPTGQARVRIGGKDHYLGAFGSPASRAAYDRLIAEWLSDRDPNRVRLTIDDLALLFLEYAKGYYRHPDGTPTRTADHFRMALRPLVQLFGTMRIEEFGPRALKSVRENMVTAGHCRNYVNSMIGKIKRVFRWGVEEELVPSTIYQGLAAISGLRLGRTTARESAPVRPVNDAVVNATLPHLPELVSDMVRLQLLTGMRPGEVCALRPCEIDQSNNLVWAYRPTTHKTAHHGRERRIYIGPEGQQVLRRYLEVPPDDYCFSPAKSESLRNQSRKASRQSPMTPSQAARKSKGRPLQRRYTRNSYNRVIQRACEVAFGMPEQLRYVYRHVVRLKRLTKVQQQMEKERLNKDAAAWRAEHCWSPNQLRHNRATAIRHRYGIEAAQTVLGHSDPRVTEIYAERDFATAARIMSEIG